MHLYCDFSIFFLTCNFFQLLFFIFVVFMNFYSLLFANFQNFQISSSIISITITTSFINISLHYCFHFGIISPFSIFTKHFCLTNGGKNYLSLCSGKPSIKSRVPTFALNKVTHFLSSHKMQKMQRTNI